MGIATEPSVIPAEAQHDIPDVPIYRLSVAQYRAMARAGILDEDAPVELLEGWLVQKMTKYRPHSICLHLTRRALETLLPAGWYVSIQDPISTLDSEPEPDIAVVRGDADDYPDAPPGPADVPLVVEIADTSLRTDRSAKLRVYARAGILVYWIVNLKERQIEVYANPTSIGKRPAYRAHQIYAADSQADVILEGVPAGRIIVREILPRTGTR
jgi:Uma2 family endonuclease